MALEELIGAQPSPFPINPMAIQRAREVERNRQLMQAILMQGKMQQQRLHERQMQANIAQMQAETEAQQRQNRMAPHADALALLGKTNPQAAVEYARAQGIVPNTFQTQGEQAIARFIQPQEVGTGPGQHATMASALPILRQRVKGYVDAGFQRIMKIPDTIRRAQEYDKFVGENQAAAKVVGIELPDFDRLNLAQAANEVKLAQAMARWMQENQKEGGRNVRAEMQEGGRMERSRTQQQTQRDIAAETARLRKEQIKEQGVRNYYRRGAEQARMYDPNTITARQGAERIRQAGQRFQSLAGYRDALLGQGQTRLGMEQQRFGDEALRGEIRQASGKRAAVLDDLNRLVAKPPPAPNTFDRAMDRIGESTKTKRYNAWLAEKTRLSAELQKAEKELAVLNAQLTAGRAPAKPKAVTSPPRPASRRAERQLVESTTNPIQQAIRDRKRALSSDVMFE